MEIKKKIKSKEYEMLRKKLFMDRTSYLREVKGKTLTLDQTTFLMFPRKVASSPQDEDYYYCPTYVHPFNEDLLENLNRLDKEIIEYQLINHGYSKDEADTISNNILNKKEKSYSYRSIDIRDYEINKDLTVKEKSIEEKMKNLKVIDYTISNKKR